MNSLKVKTLIITIAMFTIACGKREMPGQMLGTWMQKDNEKYKLRFEQSENGPEVYLSIITDDWYGPLEIEMGKADTAIFTIKEVSQTTGNKTITMRPPEVTQDIQHLMDQNGRILVRSYMGIKMEGVVKVYLSGENLVTDGLWATMQNNQWDKNGKSIDVTIIPLKTTFTRLDGKTD